MPDGVRLEFNGAAIAHKPGVGMVTFEKNGKRYAIGPLLDQLDFEHDTNGMFEAIGGSKRQNIRYSIALLMIAAGRGQTRIQDLQQKIDGARAFLQHFQPHFPSLEHYIATGSPPTIEA